MRARRSGRDKVGGQGWTRPSSGREQTVGVRDVRSPRGHTRKVMGQAGVEERGIQDGGHLCSLGAWRREDRGLPETEKGQTGFRTQCLLGVEGPPGSGMGVHEASGPPRSGAQ